jgi:ABC-type maltose transport system permease subunit
MLLILGLSVLLFLGTLLIAIPNMMLFIFVQGYYVMFIAQAGIKE